AYIGSSAGQREDPEVTGQKILQKDQFDEALLIEVFHAAVITANTSRVVPPIEIESPYRSCEMRIRTGSVEDQLRFDRLIGIRGDPPALFCPIETFCRCAFEHCDGLRPLHPIEQQRIEVEA